MPVLIIFLFLGVFESLGQFSMSLDINIPLPGIFKK